MTFTQYLSMSKEDRAQQYLDLLRNISCLTASLIFIKTTPPSHITFNNTVSLIRPKMQMIEQQWDMLCHLYDTRSRESFEIQHLHATEAITKMRHDIYTDQKLYGIYRQLLSHSSETDLEQQLFLEEQISYFNHNGIELAKSTQRQIGRLDKIINSSMVAFDNNIMQSTHAWVRLLSPEEMASLPLDYHTLFSEAFHRNKDHFPDINDGYALSLSDKHTSIILEHSSLRELRETIFKARLNQCTKRDAVSIDFDNTVLCDELLQARRQRAQLLGYDSLRAFNLSNRFITAPEKIDKILSTLLRKIEPLAAKELSELQKFAASLCFEHRLEQWDIPYYRTLYCLQELGLDFEMLREHFELNHVLQGMSQYFGELFHLHIEIETAAAAHSDDNIICLRVFDEQRCLLGQVFCDIFMSPFKQDGAYMTGLQPSLLNVDGSWSPGTAVIVANFQPHQTQKMSFDDVKTLCHEFGHALHHLLLRHPVVELGGISQCPLDIVEIPSQLLENYCYHPEMLRQISHNQLSDEMIQKIIASKKYCAALDKLYQLQLALFDWYLYGPENPCIKTAQEYVQERIAHPELQRLLQDSYHPETLSHIFTASYDAGLYSYLYADLYVSHILEKIQTDSNISSMSYQFRKIFLEQSGNMALLKKQLHEDFLQSSLKIQPFIRGITAESNRPSSQKILAFSRQQLIETRFCLKKRSISQISSGSC